MTLPADLIGKHVVRVGESEPRISPGPELTGLTTTDWYYADAWIDLDDGRSIVLCGQSVSIQPTADRPPASPPSYEDVTPCIGKPVLDIVQSEYYELVIVLFPEGLYLRNTFNPGGSRIIVDNVSCWEPEERKELTSLISGELVSLE